MKKSTIIGGAIVMVVYIIISFLVRNTEAIWLQTRITGLAAFVSLFLTVLIGELRILKQRLKIFRYHKPLGIFSVYLVGLHFIAAILDNFMWGKGVPFYEYLGFSFSNKWLLFVSLGTIAAYLLLLIGTTSSVKNMRRLGHKRWKLIHYFAYAAFILAYIHSVNLGTDLKSSVFSPVVSALFIASFILVIGLLLTRITKGVNLVKTPGDALITAIILLALLITMVLTTTTIANNLATIEEMKITSALEAEQVAAYEADILALETQNKDLTEVLNGT